MTPRFTSRANIPKAQTADSLAGPQAHSRHKNASCHRALQGDPLAPMRKESGDRCRPFGQGEARSLRVQVASRVAWTRVELV